MDTWALTIPPLAIILRTAVVYLIILIGLRLAGKREIGQMTIFDLVMLLLISNAVQNAMVGPDVSLTGGILAAVVLLVMNYVIARMRLYFPVVRRLVEGTPTLLVLHGEILTRNLNREGLDRETLETALREHGIAEVSEVEMAVLEVDGSISVVPIGANHRRVKNPAKFLKPR